MERIVLAYSGGLDTSVAVPWLAETRGAEVVAVTLDLGQGRELESVRERALAAGAVRAHVLDARAEFADRHVLPALQAGAVYEGGDPLATALGRPLIARVLVDIARIEGATAIAHGCTGAGNDEARIDVSVRALDPGLTVIAPARAWGMTRSGKIEYARQHGIPAPAAQASPYAIDANLWGRSAASGALDDPWVEAPADVYALTADPARCPDEPAYVEIAFERGVPVSINGVAMPFLDIIGSLGTIAGNHGVGRLDMVENRLVGIKSRTICEAPAAVVLHQAHRDLEGFVITRDLERVKRDLARTYADLVYNGLWYSPLREAIDAFVARTQEHVTGTIRMKLFKGSSHVVGRQSPYALYDREPHTCGEGEALERSAAEGFMRIWGLPLEAISRRQPRAAAPARGTEAA